MARAANTGITAWIDVTGRIGGAPDAGHGILPNYTPDRGLAAGFLGAEIPLPPLDAPPTFYVRHGDVFALACLALAALAFATTALPGRARSLGGPPG